MNDHCDIIKHYHTVPFSISSGMNNKIAPWKCALDIDWLRAQCNFYFSLFCRNASDDMDNSKMENTVKEFCFISWLLWIWCWMIQYTLVNGLLQSSCAILLLFVSLILQHLPKNSFICELPCWIWCTCGCWVRLLGFIAFGQIMDMTWVRELVRNWQPDDCSGSFKSYML